MRAALVTLGLSAALLPMAAGPAQATVEDGKICGSNTAAFGYHVETCIIMQDLEFRSPVFRATASYSGGSTDVRFYVYLKRQDTSDTLAQYPASGQAGILTTRPSGSSTFEGDTGTHQAYWASSNPSIYGHCYTAVTYFTESGVWHWGAISNAGFCI